MKWITVSLTVFTKWDRGIPFIPDPSRPSLLVSSELLEKTIPRDHACIGHPEGVCTPPVCVCGGGAGVTERERESSPGWGLPGK